MAAQSTRIKHMSRGVPSSLDLQTHMREELATGTAESMWAEHLHSHTVPGMLLVTDFQSGETS